VLSLLTRQAQGMMAAAANLGKAPVAVQVAASGSAPLVAGAAAPAGADATAAEGIGATPVTAAEAATAVQQFAAENSNGNSTDGMVSVDGDGQGWLPPRNPSAEAIDLLRQSLDESDGSLSPAESDGSL